jgi:hypothetical protein
MTSDYKAASERTDADERNLSSALPQSPRMLVTYRSAQGVETHVQILTGGHAVSSEKLGRLAVWLSGHRERKAVIHAEDLRSSYLDLIAATALLAEPEADDCPHDENDHGICLDCGKDIFDDIVAAAEAAADCREDR